MRVVANSEFNGKKILAGDLAGGLSIQVGATTDTNSRINVAVSDMSTLLKPVTTGTLNPNGKPVDATLAAKTTELAAGATAALDPQLIAANKAAKDANAAVVAAKAAAAAPTDLALAKEASRLNLVAANSIKASSDNIKATTDTNLGKSLVSAAFQIGVTNANSSNTGVATAVATADAAVQAKVAGTDTTSAADAASILTTATQLATAAATDVASAAQNAYATTMFNLTGDTLAANSAAATTTTPSTYELNNAVLRSTLSGDSFGKDREAQKAIAGLAIAKAISGASFVEDPLATTTANGTNKTSFINNSKLVMDASTKADAVATDYALSAINYIDAAIASIDTERSNLGSTQNRFTTTISNLQNGIENQSAAKSRILDADFAAETANLSKGQILQQAGTAMLAQANQSGQSVMTLLR